MNGRAPIPGCAIYNNADPMIPSRLQFINSPHNGLVSRLCFPSPLAQKPVVVRTLHSRAQTISLSLLGMGEGRERMYQTCLDHQWLGRPSAPPTPGGATQEDTQGPMVTLPYEFVMEVYLGPTGCIGPL